MKYRNIGLAFVLIGLTLAGAFLGAVTPVRANPGWVVSLDANSTSQTDVTVTSSASQSKSFRVGAVINASSTSPLSVFGWQFTVYYNATAFVPQGDPDPASLYPDGAANTVLFGAQTATGTVNWAGKIAAGQAFGSSSITHNVAPFQDGITVFYSILSPNPSVNVQAISLLANVNFELLPGHQADPQSFTVSDVIFADGSGRSIPGVIAGPGCTESVNNEPPLAMFAVTPAPNLGEFAFNFDASGSFDSDGSISNPAGYFWDFGDGTQDLGVSGPTLNYDYGVAGRFHATLRVQDNLGATGSARDSLGNVVTNIQPSHASLNITSGTPRDEPPFAIFTFSPGNPIVGQPVAFDGSSSFDPDGFIVDYAWDFGDGSSPVHSASPIATHMFAASGSFTVTLTALDNGNLTGTTSSTVPVLARSVLVAVDMNPSTPNTIDPFGVFPGNFSVNVDVSNVTSLFAWQFSLSYDNAFLSTQEESVVFGPFWRAAISNGTAIPIVGVNQTSGVVTVALSLLNPMPAFSGAGVLANIGFSAVTTGTSTLSLVNVILLDPSVTIIPSQAQNGQVTIDVPPIAILHASPTVVSVGQSVFFDPSSSFDPDGVVTGFLLSFGDGGFSRHLPTEHAYIAPGSYTAVLTAIDNIGLTGNATVVIQVGNVFDQPPVALFTFSPSSPTVGQNVFFDGSASFDSDGFVESWTWDFGDFSSAFSFSPTISHSYSSPGNYTVSLTVRDNMGLSGTTSMTLVVQPRPSHDVGIVSIYASPRVVVSSQTVGIQVALTNRGGSNETVSLSAYYDDHLIETINGIVLQPCTFYCYYSYFFIPWDTTGIPPGNYTISATVLLATDQNPTDNSLTDGQVQVLPPPLLQATPSSGPDGTKVLVRGSGFPSFQSPYGPSVIFVDVSFDDQFVGFILAYDGQFNFTFNIPLAQPGAHLIKAFDTYSGARASTNFTVLPTPSTQPLSVSLDTGAVYFPGDTAVIYTLVTLNGAPMGPQGVQVQLILVRPNGSNATLQTTSVGPGLYKATYAVPATGSLGTYALVVVVHATVSSGDGAAVKSFVVKPTWIQSQGRNVGTALAVASVLGVIGVAWKKGYLRRREDDSLVFSS